MKLRLADNTSRVISRIHSRDASNASRLWSKLHIRTADNTSRIGFDGAASELTATPDYDAVFGATNSHTPIPTNIVTVTVTGGKAPYSASWSTMVGWTVSAPTALATRFVSAPVLAGDSAEATFTCTVTDANGDTATCDVAASVTNYGA